LFKPIFVPDNFRETVSGRAWLRAMLDAEGTLAIAQARVGLIPLEAVATVASCCEAPRFDPDAYSSRARTVREHGLAEVADAVLERWFTPAFREGHPDILEWAGRMLRETPPEGYAGCCEAVSGADLSGRPGGIRAPTLIISGAEDPAAPPHRSESIRDSVPDARLVILSPAAHLANVEGPGATTGAMLEHLQAVARKEK
jgi:3-oxoadipate enol-lactonase